MDAMVLVVECTVVVVGIVGRGSSCRFQNEAVESDRLTKPEAWSIRRRGLKGLPSLYIIISSRAAPKLMKQNVGKRILFYFLGGLSIQICLLRQIMTIVIVVVVIYL